MTVLDSESWPVVRDGGGDMVNVPMGGQPRVMIKMRREEAIRLGLLKEQEPGENKMQQPAKNKKRGRPRKE